MATLRQDKRTQCWSIRFYWNGEQHQRTCRTKRKSVAIRTLAVVEETLEDLKRHKVSIPENLRLDQQLNWILSGGRQSTNAAANHTKISRKGRLHSSLGNICDVYLSDQAQKQETTVSGEKVHIKHLKKLFGSRTPQHSLESTTSINAPADQVMAAAAASMATEMLTKPIWIIWYRIFSERNMVTPIWMAWSISSILILLMQTGSKMSILGEMEISTAMGSLMRQIF